MAEKLKDLNWRPALLRRIKSSAQVLLLDEPFEGGLE